MNLSNTNRLSLLAGMLCLLSALLTGCTKQSLSECPEKVEADVRVLNAEGEDITEEGAIWDLSLYVFDKDRLFLERLGAQIGISIPLYFPDQETLHVISWGNLTGEGALLPELAKGTPMHEAVIRLLDNPVAERSSQRVTRSIARCPDDLFYSSEEIAVKTGSPTHYIIRMKPSVSSMAVTMRNLQSYSNRYDENFSLMVRETYNAIDFNARLTGKKVGYVPLSSFNDKKELTTPLFNLLPSQSEGMIEIDIYHENELITTVKRDSEGKPLKTQTGRVLNVLVDFQVNTEVEVSVTPWKQTHIWKDF